MGRFIFYENRKKLSHIVVRMCSECAAGYLRRGRRSLESRVSPSSWRENAHITEAVSGAGAGAGAEAGPGVARQERLLCVVNNDLRRFVSWVMTSSQPPFMSSSISLILCQTCKLHGAFRTCDLFSHANFPRKMETQRGVQTQRHHHHYSKSRQIPKGSRFHVCRCIVRTVV